MKFSRFGLDLRKIMDAAVQHRFCRTSLPTYPVGTFVLQGSFAPAGLSPKTWHDDMPRGRVMYVVMDQRQQRWSGTLGTTNSVFCVSSEI